VSRDGGPSIGPESPTEGPATIVRRLIGNIAALVQLYTLASGREARALGRSIALTAILIGAAALIGVYAVGLLLAAAVLALSLVMKPWAAALVVLALAVLMITLLLVIGVRRLLGRIRRLRGVITAFVGEVRWLWTELFRSV
jgi:Putative Actinobacterial Holin-X, holin superfamily III